jgi:hydroxymethylbilane synthase
MLPAPGQGALAVETRSGDSATSTVATALNHEPSSIAVTAERAFLRRMEGGCNVPVAAHALVEKDGIRIEGLVIAPDGRHRIRETIRDKKESAAQAAALLADRLLERGGRAILDAL